MPENQSANIDQDLELDILHHIHTTPNGVRQRDLATIVGRSLGMTNAILHRLTEKGLLTVSKVNNRNISYVVTSHGIKKLAGRSFRYFKRTIKNVVDYKDAIEQEVVAFSQAAGASSLVLVGKSDLDFIVEHMALKYHLEFVRREPGYASTETELCFLSENLVGSPSGVRQVSLFDLVEQKGWVQGH